MDRCFRRLDCLATYSYTSIIHLHSQGSSNCFRSLTSSRAVEVGVDVGAYASVQRIIGVSDLIADGTAPGLDSDLGEPFAVVV